MHLFYLLVSSKNFSRLECHECQQDTDSYVHLWLPHALNDHKIFSCLFLTQPDWHKLLMLGVDFWQLTLMTPLQLRKQWKLRAIQSNEKLNFLSQIKIHYCLQLQMSFCQIFYKKFDRHNQIIWNKNRSGTHFLPFPAMYASLKCPRRYFFAASITHSTVSRGIQVEFIASRHSSSSKLEPSSPRLG